MAGSNDFQTGIAIILHGKLLSGMDTGRVVPIYKKYLTEYEVKSIIEFYESEAGKSLISKTPMILQESMEAGGKLGEEIATQIFQEIEKESLQPISNTDVRIVGSNK